MTNSAENASIGLTENRPSNSQLYPWYDSVWLSKYEEAKNIIREARPEKLAEFIDAFRVLHTRPDFKVKLLEQPFDAATFTEIKQVASSLHPTDLELHEARRFGRFVVHDLPFFAELQQRTVAWMSELVGEPLEVSYNFLSLYTAKGVCAVHMDSPEAKWTLDLCIDQGAPWPIYFSDVQPWPDTASESWKTDSWENNIKQGRSLQFTSCNLEPGQAVVFSGSSQWHYRDPMPEENINRFCTLLFFHFLPEGTRDLIRPKNWARLFGIAELAGLKNVNPD